MDSDLISIISQKKNAIKTFSVKGTELNSSKSIKINGDMTCNTVFCDNIEINPTGKKTEIKDAIITVSSLDSTPIGLIEPSTAYVTQLNVLSTINGNESQGIKIDGDINISNTDEKLRNIISTNPLKISSTQDVTLLSTKKISINSDENMCEIKSSTQIDLSSIFLNINTNYIYSRGFISIQNTLDSNNINSGSLITKGGMGVTKNINIGGDINILGNLNLLNNNTFSDMKGSLSVTKNISTSGFSLIKNTTDSFNTTSGSCIINGGVGIAKNINIGGNINVGGNSIMQGTIESHNIQSGLLVLGGGIGIAKNTNIGGNINVGGNSIIQGTFESYNIQSGSLVLGGGIGIKKNTNIGGNINVGGNSIIQGTFESNNIQSGSLVLGGGIGIGKNTNIGGNINVGGNSIIQGTFESNNIQSGSLVLGGGIGIAKNTNIGGNINVNGDSVINGYMNIGKNTSIDGSLDINDTTQSINSNTGALQINGGLGIKKNINVDGSVVLSNVNETLYVTGSTTIKDNLYIDGNIVLKGSILDESGNSNSNTVTSGEYNDLIIRDDLIIDGTDESFNTDSGSIVANGGVGIKKSLYVGKDFNILGNATFHNNVNCIKTLYADNIHVKYNITSSEGNISGSGGTGGKIGVPDISFDSLVGNINLSNNLSISNGFQKIDQWLNTHLIDTPPILTNTLNNPIMGGEYMEFDWNLPIQIFVGFLNKKLPIISSIYLDYKLSSQTNWDTFTTINFNSSNITKIRIYPIPHTQNIIYISDSYIHLYNFTKETLYDFRVYAKNENSIRTNKYLYFNSLKTIPSNTPQPPQNISITKNNNNPSKSIDISWEQSISENLPIYKYNVNWNSIESIKYPNYIQHDSNIITSSSSIFNNANNFITGQNLYPGHKYNVNIQSKNILNDTYGQFSYDNTDIITTDYPIAPNYTNSYNIHISNKNNYLFNINQGYSLDGNVFIENIFNYNTIDNSFKTTSLENLRINENISTTDENTTKLITILNNNSTSIYSNLNLDGFSHSITSTSFTDKTNIIINNENDYYSDDFNKGFYKKGDFHIEFYNPQNYFKPSINPYTLQIFQNLPYSNINYNTNLFKLHIEELNTFAAVSNINISSLSDYQTETISGVPTFLSGNINFDFISHNITNTFLRSDKKHFNIFSTNSLNQTFSSNLNITSDLIKNSSSMFYKNLDDTKHNTDGKIILPNTSDILFKNISLNINTTQSTNNLHLNIIPYNLHGESSVYKTSTPIQLNIDSQSIETKNNINNPSGQYGLYVTSGNTTYPSTPSVDFGNTFNHSVNITNTLDLQLTNGYFSTPYNINAFQNYSNYFYNNILTYYNYSSVIPSFNKRYITFKYSNLLNDTNKITIELIEFNSTEILSSNFTLHLKIHNLSNSQFNTSWLNANKCINNIGINNNTKNIDDTGCLNLYYPSTNKKKYCYLPNGSTGDLYIRLGFQTNQDLLIKYIKVISGFI